MLNFDNTKAQDEQALRRLVEKRGVAWVDTQLNAMQLSDADYKERMLLAQQAEDANLAIYGLRDNGK